MTLFGDPDFDLTDEPAARAADADSPSTVAEADALYAGVALENSLDRVLDYSVPRKLRDLIAIGQRVRVPLGAGNRPAFGYVISLHDTTSYPRIKPLSTIDDDRVLIDPRLMELARWMSRYYVCPLGAVIESILPSAVKKKTGLTYTPQVRLLRSREEIQALLEKTKAPKRRAILARLLLLEPEASIELIRLANEAGATAATVRKLSGMGLIRITSEVDLPRMTTRGEGPSQNASATLKKVQLNADQHRVLTDLQPHLAGGFSVHLILGVTGSGKTEIYLRAIDQVVRSGKQAIVLVPEIALTPQTVRRFTQRFDRVCVLHSGLGGSDRHRQWQQIAQGDAQVVVGARSGIFAPTRNLGIIVIDEEHEASYKQDQLPRYHGRDVAIKRAQMEQIPILLGSATPSLETYYKVRSLSQKLQAAQAPSSPTPANPASATSSATPSEPTGTQTRTDHPAPRGLDSNDASNSEGQRESIKPIDSATPPYLLHRLPRRVHNQAMPAVELIDMAQERKLRKGVHLLSVRMEHLLKHTLSTGNQAILLLNRRGYSNFIYCPSCAEPIKCKYCDATMTYHRSAGTHVQSANFEKGVHTGQMHCHYCLAVQPLPSACPSCKKKLTLFGLGTQRVEEELARKMPDLRFARVDGDTMRNLKDYEAMLAKFASGEIQVMLGTQMIAKGLDYPNVTLVGVVSGDTALALPDFRAAERTFQLITQVAGRAGRGDKAGRVVLQTFQPQDPTILAATRQDYEGFAERELQLRHEVGLPPYGRIARIILRDTDENRVQKLGDTMALKLTEAINSLQVPGLFDPAPSASSTASSTPAPVPLPLTLKGPMPCAISRIAGYHRMQIVLTSPRSELLQRLLATLRGEGALAKTDRIAVDVDPTSLL